MLSWISIFGCFVCLYCCIHNGDLLQMLVYSSDSILMDGPKIIWSVTLTWSFWAYDVYFIFYLQTASALACAAVSKGFQENLLQAPLWSRSSSTESSLAKDNSTDDVNPDQRYMVLVFCVNCLPLLHVALSRINLNWCLWTW